MGTVNLLVPNVHDTSNMTGATSGEGSAYPSEASDVTPNFDESRVA